MAQPQTKTQNFTLGAGYVYWDAEDSAGALTGERYIGDTPNFAVNITTEILEVDDADGPVAETVIKRVTKITRGGALDCRDVDDDNLSTFVMGELETVTQPATPIVDESVGPVQQGLYYQLGAGTANPTGVRNVGSVVVTSDPAGTTHTVTTDYITDAANANIYIVPGGGISDDDPLLVDYTPVSNSRTRVKTNDDGAHTGALRFRADNTEGIDKEVYIPKCELAANGDLAFKSRDDVIVMTFELNIMTRTGYEQVYIDGVAA